MPEHSVEVRKTVGRGASPRPTCIDRHHVSVSRRLIAWFVTLPLAIAGTQVAHALAYRLTISSNTERTHELSSTGHGYAAYLPLALAIGAVLVAYALVAEVRHIAAASPGRARPRVLHFAVVAPAVFATQEHVERLVHDGSYPWTTALAASFVAGLLLQVPFGLITYVLARLLLGAAGTFGDLLAVRRQPARLRPAVVLWPVATVARPHASALALGYGSRGPPAPSR